MALKTKLCGTAMGHKAKDYELRTQKIPAQEIFDLQGEIMLNSYLKNSTLLDMFIYM